ncbi:MAG: NUDIX domain-containing protein [Alphaproteobacteria bacterium]
MTGVSVLVRRWQNFVLVKRANPPYAGYWSLPGGKIEAGEAAEAAVRRELFEETGLTLGACHRVKPVTVGAGGQPEYDITVFVGTRPKGQLRAASDAVGARWAELADLDQLALTPGTAALIAELLDNFTQL